VNDRLIISPRNVAAREGATSTERSGWWLV
jgi:hypothetical protein